MCESRNLIPKFIVSCHLYNSQYRNLSLTADYWVVSKTGFESNQIFLSSLEESLSLFAISLNPETPKHVKLRSRETL